MKVPRIWIWIFFLLTDACPLAPAGGKAAGRLRRAVQRRAGDPLGDTVRAEPRASRAGDDLLDTHDKALDFWLARMQCGELSAPFDVVHVDTHSDLAFGPPGTDFAQGGADPQTRCARRLKPIARERSSTRRIICSSRWPSAGSAG